MGHVVGRHGHFSCCAGNPLDSESLATRFRHSILGLPMSGGAFTVIQNYWPLNSGTSYVFGGNQPLKIRTMFIATSS